LAKLLPARRVFTAVTGSICRDTELTSTCVFTRIPVGSILIGYASGRAIRAIPHTDTTEAVTLAVLLANLAVGVSLRKADELIEGVISLFATLHLANRGRLRWVTVGHCVLNRSLTGIATSTAILQGAILPGSIQEVFIHLAVTIIV